MSTSTDYYYLGSNTSYVIQFNIDVLFFLFTNNIFEKMSQNIIIIVGWRIRFSEKNWKLEYCH